MSLRYRLRWHHLGRLSAWVALMSKLLTWGLSSRRCCPGWWLNQSVALVEDKRVSVGILRGSRLLDWASLARNLGVLRILALAMVLQLLKLATGWHVSKLLPTVVVQDRPRVCLRYCRVRRRHWRYAPMDLLLQLSRCPNLLLSSHIECMIVWVLVMHLQLILATFDHHLLHILIDLLLILGEISLLLILTRLLQ
jgi:hypothetical protein